MGASLRCGLEALPEDAEAAVVLLADGPDLAPEAIDRVITAWRGGAGEALAASYGAAAATPCCSAGQSGGSPDEGARDLVSAFVHLDDLGHPGDVDHPEDFRPREA